MSLGANSLPGRSETPKRPRTRARAARGRALRSVGGGARVGAPDFTLPPSASAGGAYTSAGQGQSSADVGSGSRSSLRRRVAALSRCCVVPFPSSYTPRSRRRPGADSARLSLAACSPPPRVPASLGRTVRRLVGRPAPR